MEAPRLSVKMLNKYQPSMEDAVVSKMHVPGLFTTDLRKSIYSLFAPHLNDHDLAPGENIIKSSNELIVNLTGFINQLIKIAFLWRNYENKSIATLF